MRSIHYPVTLGVSTFHNTAPLLSFVGGLSSQPNSVVLGTRATLRRSRKLSNSAVGWSTTDDPAVEGRPPMCRCECCSLGVRGNQ